MSDDDLIRDAVHELVAAAPDPKPLPTGETPAGRSYRWLAIVAAAILVVGGIVAIAWSQSDDGATPVATTAPPPQPTPPPTTVITSTPDSTVPVTVPPSAPSTEATTTSTTSSTTSSTSTTTSTSTVPPTPEQAQLQDYLTALAQGRYAEAAVVLNEGGLEPERRADLRPLFDEYGDVDDLAARLQSWCENEAICAQPDAAPVDTGSYWVATWTTAGGPVTAYFRSGSYEGAPNVHGLPPRRPAGTVVPCPTNVQLVREADLDGDGAPETVVITGGPLLETCNTALAVAPLTLPTGSHTMGVLNPTSESADTLLIGTSDEQSTCGATYRMAASAGALVQVGWEGCWGPNTGTSIGCRDVGTGTEIVAYEYSFVGGDTLDTSTSMNVDVLTLDGAPLDSFTLTLPDQIEQGFQIVEPHCNNLPVMTEG